MSRGKVTIIGSGPAGVSAAWPLVQAGIDVLMLDAGKSVSTNPDSFVLRMHSESFESSKMTFE